MQKSILDFWIKKPKVPSNGDPITNSRPTAPPDTGEPDVTTTPSETTSEIGDKRKADNQEIEENCPKIAKLSVFDILEPADIPAGQSDSESDILESDRSPILFHDSEPEAGRSISGSQTSEISIIPDTQDMNENNFKTYADSLKVPTKQSLKSDPTVQILYDLNNVPNPYPAKFVDIWDENHVRMPFSAKNLYPMKTGDKKEVCSRWSLIQKSLQDEMLCAQDIEDAILTYNSRFKSSWNFRLLHLFFEREATLDERLRFFDSTLPKMQKLCLESKNYFTRPPKLLKKGSNGEIYLTQQQCSIILVMAFFCLFPRRNSSKSTSEYSTYNSINFNRIFGLPPESHNFEKLRTLINYFNRICSKTPPGVVSFHRCKLGQFPDWTSAPELPAGVKVDCQGLIEEEGHKYIQMDFANKYIGGGVLGHGLVQEEIRFIISPELIVTMLITEELDDDEALIMTGCEKFSDYSGYANSYQFKSDHNDSIPRDILCRKMTQVVAMDAIPYYDDPSEQYLISNITRDLNKSYVSFVSNKTNESAIATGNWGCGAFCGNPHLKFIIQLMSAAVSRRSLIYFTFHDHKLKAELDAIYSQLKQKSVAEIFDLLGDYEPETCSLFDFISANKN